jgi:hypothetical protein
VFQKWGVVREVFLPIKRNKYGKRFGFVRFFDVKDPKRLETNLDNIRMNETKLHVNLPRFSKSNGKNKSVARINTELGKLGTLNSDRIAQNRTFAHVVLHGPEKNFSKTTNSKGRNMGEKKYGAQGMIKGQCSQMIYRELIR